MGFKLTTGSGRKWDVQKDRFTAVLVSHEERDFKDENGRPKKSFVLTFRDEKGETLERNSTTAWDRWMGFDIQGKGKGRKVVKVTPKLHPGDVVRIEKIEETTKGTRRFFNFTLDVLTGKERPAWARKQ